MWKSAEDGKTSVWSECAFCCLGIQHYFGKSLAYCSHDYVNYQLGYTGEANRVKMLKVNCCWVFFFALFFLTPYLIVQTFLNQILGRGEITGPWAVYGQLVDDSTVWLHGSGLYFVVDAINRHVENKSATFSVTFYWPLFHAKRFFSRIRPLKTTQNLCDGPLMCHCCLQPQQTDQPKPQWRYLVHRGSGVRGSRTQIEATRRETSEKPSNPVIFLVTLGDKRSGVVVTRESLRLVECLWDGDQCTWCASHSYSWPHKMWHACHEPPKRTAPLQSIFLGLLSSLDPPSNQFVILSPAWTLPAPRW